MFKSHPAHQRIKKRSHDLECVREGRDVSTVDEVAETDVQLTRIVVECQRPNCADEGCECYLVGGAEGGEGVRNADGVVAVVERGSEVAG